MWVASVLVHGSGGQVAMPPTVPPVETSTEVPRGAGISMSRWRSARPSTDPNPQPTARPGTALAAHSLRSELAGSTRAARRAGR